MSIPNNDRAKNRTEKTNDHISNINEWQQKMLDAIDRKLSGKAAGNLASLIGEDKEIPETTLPTDEFEALTTARTTVNRLMLNDANTKYKDRIEDIKTNSTDPKIVNFIAKYKQYAIYIFNKTGIDVRIPLSIIAIEGAWGAKTPIMVAAKPYGKRTINSNNLFNIKTTPAYIKAGGRFGYAQDETPTEQFRIYRNGYESCDDWIELMTRPLYKHIVDRYKTQPEQFLFEMYKVYATDVNAGRNAANVAKYFVPV